MTTVLKADTVGQDLQAESLMHEAGLIRIRRCRYGPMAYIRHDSYIGRSLDLYGEFSPGEAEFFSQVLRPGSWALDVGANIGAHTVLFAQKVSPKGAVIAFEPQRVIHELLSTNLMLNGLLNVIPRHAAAGSKEGTLMVPAVNYGVEGNYGCLGLGKYTEGEPVPIEVIDRLDLPACHLIKVDVEGMELEVLKGAEATIRRHKPVLYVENDREDKSAALNAFILGLDYDLYWHMTPYYSPKNLFANPHNEFVGIASINMIGLPKGSPLKLNGVPPVEGVDDTWVKARDRFSSKR